MHDELQLLEFQWQTGYGAFAVSYSNVDAVKSYLANQEGHHRRQSFQDEFRELLRRHHLEWDERYVWIENYCRPVGGLNESYGHDHPGADAAWLLTAAALRLRSPEGAIVNSQAASAPGYLRTRET